MPEYYDVSLPIEDGMLSWPSDPPVSLKPFKTLAEQGSNLTKLESGNHFGTHIDAPSHTVEGGRGLEAYELDQLIGPATLYDLTEIEGNDITVEHLEETVSDGVERVLFKTRNTTDRLLTKPFTEDYVALSGEAAVWLAEAGAKLVGIDYLSIQRRGGDRRAHTALSERDIVIIEGLWLDGVPAGEYELIALPLRIKDGDGAPARVILKA
jgi:arylformamidase